MKTMVNQKIDVLQNGIDKDLDFIRKHDPEAAKKFEQITKPKPGEDKLEVQLNKQIAEERENMKKFILEQNQLMLQNALKSIFSMDTS